MIRKIETLEPRFYGNDVETFVVLPNGLIFLISSVDYLDDAKSIEKLPKNVLEIGYPLGIKIPDWIWHEVSFVITTSDQNYWEICGATSETIAKRICSREYQGGCVSAVLSIGVMDGRGRIIKLSSRGNYPGSKWSDNNFKEVK